MTNRRRLDVELVRRGLVPSRQVARACVEAGRVTVGGAPALKVARLVGADEPVTVTPEDVSFASRGGHKLDAALDRFDVAVDGRRVLDAGASTGGFTDCVLQRGASSVVAVDVGYGQLALHLRDDPRVDVRERTNVRYLTSDDVQPPVDVVVADLSFISLLTVAPAFVAVSADDADMVLLVKPQFEAGRAEANRGGGVIRDPAVWRSVLESVLSKLAATGEMAVMDVMLSPVKGPQGNREFLVHLRRSTSPPRHDDRCALDAHAVAAIDAAVAEAIDEAVEPDLSRDDT